MGFFFKKIAIPFLVKCSDRYIS